MERPIPATEASRLALEDGLFEIPSPGAPPYWLWARTCPTPGCDCRNALILSAAEDRGALLAAASVAHAAWETKLSFQDIAGKLDDSVVAFALDLDTALPERLRGDRDTPLERDRYITTFFERLDGEVLDDLARLWYRGKGLPDPEQASLKTERFEVQGWSPGELVGWNELRTGLRQDFYAVDGHGYEAVDLYCIKRGCSCDEVSLAFEPLAATRALVPGRVKIHRTGAVELLPEADRGVLLERLWVQFRARHPRYLARLDARDVAMKKLGNRVVPSLPRSLPAKAPPRNGPCSCGSGKKYKKCCGGAAA